jgi:hypothetical protein
LEYILVLGWESGLLLDHVQLQWALAKEVELAGALGAGVELEGALVQLEEVLVSVALVQMISLEKVQLADFQREKAWVEEKTMV